MGTEFIVAKKSFKSVCYIVQAAEALSVVFVFVA